MLMRTPFLPALLVAAALPAWADAQALPEDPRQAVEMPALQRALIREDMVHHLTTLNAVLDHLAAGRLREAADLAEKDMGLAAMGRHAARTQGMGPGRFMPDAMRALGMGMHRSASEFAQVARQGDRDAAYRALAPVTAACVACHAGYRLK